MLTAIVMLSILCVGLALAFFVMFFKLKDYRKDSEANQSLMEAFASRETAIRKEYELSKLSWLDEKQKWFDKENEYEEKIDDLTIEVRDSNKRVDALTFEVNGDGKRIAELIEQNRMMNDNLTDVHNHYLEKVAENTDLLNQLSNYKEVEISSNFQKDSEEKMKVSKEIFENLKKDTDKLVAQKEQLSGEVQRYGAQLNEAAEQYDDIQDKIVQLENRLKELQTTHALAVQGGEREDKIDWVLSEKEKRVIQLIDDIIADYPELKVELGKIKWSKVWLPKFQSECKKRGWDNKGGIYLLRVKGRDDLNYVGQAVNIKDRWYTHAKKMLGAEVVGNEKVYEVGGPECFTWEVLEEGTENLNEREHYWIGYWGGLNIKG